MSGVRDADRVSGYFHAASTSWDEIYSFEGGPLYRWLNRRLRKGVYNRAARVLQTVAADRARIGSLLDVGCGTGRIALQVAEMGIPVTGIDFAPSMIRFAEAAARRASVRSSAFLVGDFLEHDFGTQTFDVSIAMGVLDYTSEAPRFLATLKRLTTNLAMVTFPVRGTPRSYVRKIRLALKGCPVYYYTREQIATLYRDAGFVDVAIERMNNMFFVTARVR